MEHEKKPRIILLMPFTEYWSKDVYNTINKVNDLQFKQKVRLERLDHTGIAMEKLEDHLIASINKADVIIADLTNNNPNVFLEVGMAIMRNKKIILISQDRDNIPIDLQGRIVRRYVYKKGEDNKKSMSNLFKELIEQINEELRLIVVEDERDKLALKATYKYSVQCYSNRSEVKLEDYFKDAEYRIDILTTNLSFLFQNYLTDKRNKEQRRSYMTEIRDSLNKTGSEVKVRILTLDPESYYAATRGEQLGFTPQIFRDQLRKSLEQTLKIAAKYKLERFEVRIYNEFPNQITYRIDDRIINCVVAQPTQSRNHLCFELNRESEGVEISFMNHFQTVWGKGKKP
jgi:nucleoside 2-deoxyribosyltransferase